MNKLFAALFAGMTAVTGYSTATNLGVQDSSFESATPRTAVPASVRRGSARSSRSTFGGSRGGK